MKIKEGYMLREAAGERIVVAVGEAARAFSGLMRLNDTAACLFRLLKNGADEAALVCALTAAYTVDEKEALDAVRGFIAELKKRNMLEEAR